MGQRTWLEALDAAWDGRWPSVAPLGHTLREQCRDRWVRFHSLPGSKRYADTEAEYAEVLRRHHAVMNELGIGATVHLISACWWPASDLEPPSPPARVGADSVAWREADDDGAIEEGRYLVFATTSGASPEALDPLLRAVADDEIGGIIITPPDVRWIYHPYDGGGDVIAPTPEDRVRLTSRFGGWLSGHRSGL